MSRLDFVAHNQLHEVLFGYLKGDEILNYRAVHSACDAVVLCFARTQLQDVIGRKMASTTLDEAPMTNVTNNIVSTVRTMDAVLVPLLVCCDEDIAEIITTAMGPPRSISHRLFHSDSDALKSKAVAAVCCSMAADWSSVNRLRHFDVSWAFGKPSGNIWYSQYPPESVFRPRAPRVMNDNAIMSFLPDCQGIRSLDVSNTYGFITDASMKRVLESCTRLTSLNVSNTSGRISDDGMIFLMVGRQRLHSLNVSGTCGSISDASLMLIDFSKLTHLDIGETDGAITDDGLKFVVLQTSNLKSLTVDRWITDE